MNHDNYQFTNVTGTAQESDKFQDSESISSAAPRMPLVLVAEDHEDTCLMLRTLLETRGFNTLEAKDGEEVVEKAVCERPDLILMDVGLPNLNGFEATRLIRNIKSLANIQIIFISGYAQESDAAQAYAAGADDFLIKPVDFDKLDSILDQLVHQNN